MHLPFPPGPHGLELGEAAVKVACVTAPWAPGLVDCGRTQVSHAGSGRFVG